MSPSADPRGAAGPETPLRILGIPGSLRRDSFNRALVRGAASLAPGGVDLGIFELHAIPLFDEDVEAAGVPAPVREMREAIAAADALLLATPEYQLGVPGVLKNALDWASRPRGASVLEGIRARLAALIEDLARWTVFLRDRPPDPEWT